MRLFLFLFLLVSCSTKNKLPKKQEPLKYQYLKRFYKLRDVLKKETKVCKSYAQKYISNVTEQVKVRGILQTRFRKKLNLEVVLKNYDPSKFDWYTSSQIKKLYLKYPYDLDIIKEHLEISNNLKDCSVEFDNLVFLNTNITLMTNSKTTKKLQNYSKKIINKYLEYIAKQEVSLIHILITNSVLLNLENKNLIEFKDRKEYLKKSKEIELRYSKTGGDVLSAFRENNYRKIYDLNNKLDVLKEEFKKYILNSYNFI